jgi:dihydroorotate dehydrogenase
MTVEVSTTIGEVVLSSPLILGSFDPLVEAKVFARCFELCGDSLGAVVTKSTTIDPREGYPEPRVSRFGAGLLVASGNPNPGIRRMASEVREFKLQLREAVLFGSIVSDSAHPQRDLADEYCFLAVEYAKAGVDGVELNLSCPHLDPADKEHTLVPAQDKNTVARLITEVRSGLAGAGFDHCLVIPKLTGWNCDPAAVALAAERAGAHAVTFSNLFPGTGYYTGIAAGEAAGSPDLRVGDHLLGHGKGGYSGKAMHSAVLLGIENLRKYLRIPVIGTGGCAADLDSLVQTFMAGAAAVEMVTPVYFRTRGDMQALLRVNELMEHFRRYLEERGFGNPGELYQGRKATGHA